MLFLIITKHSGLTYSFSLVLEIGSYSGFSALAWYEATVKQNSEIITLEIEQRMIDATKRTIERNNMQDRVTLLEGPAQDTLKSLQGTFDIVFVDADKEGYEGYVRTVLDNKLLSPNGIIICDNGTLIETSEDEGITHMTDF